MLKNYLIIVMGNLPWDWSTDYPNQTAIILSKQNTVVCYLVGEMKSIKEYIVLRRWPKIFRKYNSRLHIYTPIHFFPFQRFSVVSFMNTLLNVLFVQIIIFFIKPSNNFIGKILWVFDPQFEEIYRLFGKGFILLYDCVDYFIGSTADVKLAKIISKREELLIKRANFVFVISKTLQSIYKKIRPDVHVVPQGFRLDIFQKKVKNFSPILTKTKRMVVGYIGGINFRLDLFLIEGMVKKNQDKDFIFVGPIQEERFNKERFLNLLNFKNFTYLGSQSKKVIPKTISRFDVAILPYDSSLSFNIFSYPMKIFEYFYMGKPVISTPIKELKRFPKFIKIGKTVASWNMHMKNMLRSPWPVDYKRAQRKLALENSWEKKIEVIGKYIQ